MIVPLTVVSVVAQAIMLVRAPRRWDALETVIAVGELAAVIGIVAFHIIQVRPLRRVSFDAHWGPR
ncbi:MAG TPA: hypothetical protein VJV78_48815 [Polyangiales bacterium]|nr:hypothetical protein [Polyangiales bacterium]